MRCTACCMALTLLLSIPLHAKTSTAERFDALVRVQTGGTIEVIETLVFRFEGGTFTELVRDLPTRNTDGVQVLEASMDGQPVEFGDAVGRAEVEGRARNRVRWRFSPTSGTTRTFGLRYLVRGAVRHDDTGDLLVWRVPGGEHRWAIDASTVEFELPPGVRADARVDTRRASARPVMSDAGVRVISEAVGSNGWTETTLAMPAGSVAAAPPAWQLARERRATHATAWLATGLVVFLAGLIVLFALRQSYESPRNLAPAAPSVSLPDSIPPALAGALAANGGPALEHAAATLFWLADRGDLRVEETHTGPLRTHAYTLTRGSSGDQARLHEQAVLAAVFKTAESTVSLAKARARLTRRLSRFTRAVLDELDAAGLLDHNRRATRKSYLKVAGAMFGLAALALVTWPVLMEAHGAWPLAIPAGLAAAAVGALIFYGISTPLSNEGVQRGRQWRAYRDYLKKVSKQTGGLSVAPDAALPYAVALGLAGEWSKHLKAHPGLPPAWFHSHGDASAYAKFIELAGAGAPHHAH